MTNEEQILTLLKENQELLQKTHISAEKTRKYFLYSMIFTVITFLLPLLALVFILPSLMGSYADSLSGASLM
jgi:ABC-type arginine transport system permease subunit